MLNPIESGRETDLMTPQQPKKIALGAKFRGGRIGTSNNKRLRYPASADRWDGERLKLRPVR